MNKDLELRMYFFVPYNISPIQQGIQCGHASLEYARKYGHTELFKEFVDNHKTWIILNGGTTNNDPELLGTLNQAYQSILEFNEISETSDKEDIINFSLFYEPDLNDALTAVCFICDERVFNYEDYPEFKDYIFDDSYKRTPQNIRYVNKFKTLDELKEKFELEYIEWEKSLGGPKNVFLRNLLKGKKLA